MTQTEALKLAQEGVEIHSPNSPEYIVCAALIEALAQPEQEPAWYHAECDDPDHSGFFKEAIDAVTQVNEHGGFVTQLYTTQPQRKPCQTCESLARTVMLDQSSTDAPKRKLTDKQRREGFTQQDAQWTFRGMTAWQIWQKACDWNEAAHGIKE